LPSDADYSVHHRPPSAWLLMTSAPVVLSGCELIVLSDVGGAIGANLEACVSWIRAKVDAQGDAGGPQCHASGLHLQQ
jgi:hypothetical protein